jgi:dihydroorotate dehydrogenase (fumarate)
MDLSTTYLGFRLPHPVMPGASPLVDDLDVVRRLEDAGASALVMRSLFEEQIVMEQMASVQNLDSHEGTFAEALSYFPGTDAFRMGPDEYLEQLQRAKAAVGVPVIASLNGVSPGGWLDFARLMAEAGADALELNVYHLATDPEEAGEAVESRVADMIRSVKEHVSVPLAVKLSPFYSALAHFSRRLDGAGVDGIVLFNRFYQPDIDVDELEAKRVLNLSDSSELLLRLRWMAVLSGRVQASLAVSGGVHTALDAVKAVMTGAHAVQMVSAVLKKGPEVLAEVRQGMADWLDEHEYESLEQMQGSMSLLRCPDPRAYERANYMEILQGWEAPVP